jgi:hypothetical protein
MTKRQYLEAQGALLGVPHKCAAPESSLLQASYFRNRLIQGVSELDRRWGYDAQRLKEAMIELGVDLELYEADLDKKSRVEQDAYDLSSPRGRFCQFINAMKLPDLIGEEDDALSGLSLDDLELVWLAIHAEALALLCAGTASGCQATTVQIAMAAGKHIEMVLLHSGPLLTTRQ